MFRLLLDKLFGLGHFFFALRELHGTIVLLKVFYEFCSPAHRFTYCLNLFVSLHLKEKHFFHRVSERISKPNIFILNNRWDVSVSEPEFLEDV